MRIRFGVAGIVIASVTLILAVAVVLKESLAQQPAASPSNSGNPNFDFSVYFTGNVRGNLEPCG
jgi:hypothetical protein